MKTTIDVWLFARRLSIAAAVAITILAVMLPLAFPAAAQDQFARGPDPTVASLEAPRGPFAVTATSLSNASTPGFGAATLYFPSTTAEGTFGVLAVAPGFTAARGPIGALAERIASHGFVVINIDTNSRFDFPESRGRQLRAALQYVTESSSVRSRVDASRTAVMGHSMGGGGALEAIAADPSIDAALPLAPWNTDKTWSEVTTPTMIIGAENDSIAPNREHSIQFYDSLAASLDKVYLELNDAVHSATDASTPTVALHTVAWLKRHVDNDVRYAPFLCPGPTLSAAVSDYRATCPSGATPAVPTPAPVSPSPAPTPPAGVVLACQADAGTVQWNDAGQSKYWIYRSVDGGGSYSWIGRTLGTTTFADVRPRIGARYQVRFAGTSPFACTTGAEPANSVLDLACAVDGATVTWTDQQQDLYWVYRSTNGGGTYTWVGRTLGSTTFTDPRPAPGAMYQLRYAGAPSVNCTAG